MGLFPPPTSVPTTLNSQPVNISTQQDPRLYAVIADTAHIPQGHGQKVEGADASDLKTEATYHESLQHHAVTTICGSVKAESDQQLDLIPIFQAEKRPPCRAYLSPVSNAKSPHMASENMALPFQGPLALSQQWMMLSPVGDDDGHTPYSASTSGSSYMDDDGSDQLYQLCGTMSMQPADTPTCQWSCAPQMEVPLAAQQTPHYFGGGTTGSPFDNSYGHCVAPTPPPSWLNCPSTQYVTQSYTHGFPHYQPLDLPCSVLEAPVRGNSHLYNTGEGALSPQSDSTEQQQQAKSSGLPRGGCPQAVAGPRQPRFGSQVAPASQKKSMACKSCSKKFSSLEERDQHDSECSALPCLFAFAGCSSRCKGKNEWKRHINTQHLLSTSFQCFECAEKVFNRKDLFTQHYLRMHATKDEQEAAKARRPLPAFEQRLRYKQKDAERRDHWELPTASRCLVRDCESTFLGSDSWDKCLEHVSKHLGMTDKHQEALDQHSFTAEQIQYFINVGAIERAEDGFVLGRQSDGQRARTNKRKNTNGGIIKTSIDETRPALSKRFKLRRGAVDE